MAIKDLADRVSQQTGIPSDIIAAQWAHETGNFTNWGATQANNYGGMKQFQDQPSWFSGDATSPEGDNYQVFESPEAYADYYARYITKYYPEALNAKTPEDFARALYYNADRGYGYYGGTGDTDEEKIQNYANGIKGFAGNGSWDLAGVSTSANAFGTQTPDIPTEEPTPLTFGGYLKDKFGQGFFDNTLAGIGRDLWTRSSFLPDTSYKPSEEEFDTVLKALPNNPVAQRWVLLTAQSPEQLQKLIQLKQEDTQREERIQKYNSNWAEDVAGFGSGLIGGVVGDPTTLIPVIGQEAIGLKALGRLGTGIAKTLSTSKLLRYAEIGAQQAGMNVVSRYGAEKYAGFEQDYTSAALVGFAAGAGLSALGGLLGRVPRFNSTKGMLGALDNAESHALAQAMDMKPPSELPKLRQALEGVHDPAFVYKQGSPKLEKLANDGKVIVASKSDVAPLAKTFGIDLNTTKAFHSPSENLTVLLKDALQPGDKVDDILAHEIGVHANLRETAGDSYKAIEDTVRERMANPDASWQEAMRSVPGGGWEETLGHWVERNASAKDSLMDNIRDTFNNVARKAGRETPFSDSELRSFVARSLKAEVDRGRGYTVLPDGSTIQGNLKFSANNIMNPSIIDHMIQIEQPKGYIDKLTSGISGWTEKGWLYRTPFGVLTNSPSKIGREFASDVLEDARMRPKGTFHNISIEKQKSHIKTQLDNWVNKHYEIREKYLFDTLKTDGLPTPARMQDFNKMVREYYNATYSTNKGGLKEFEYPTAVHEAAQNIKNLWDNMVDIAKTSGEKFGYSQDKNLIESTRKFIDGEMWRRIDDRKWLKFVQKFPTVQEAREFLRDYAQQTIKRDIVKGRLEAEAKKAHEERLTKWEEKNADKERPSGKPRLRKITTQKVEDEVKELASKWSEGVSDQNLSNLDRFREDTPNELGLGDFMESRVPMDTSVVLETPWGEPFSYDIHLRSDDLDQILPRTINRFSGEVALHNRYADSKELNTERAQLAQALEHGVVYKKITASERDRNLEAFDEAIADIRGLRKDRDTKGVMNALGTSLRGMAYAENGSMFGANQLGELGGAIGVSGFKAISHFVPSFANTLRDLRAGKGAGEFATMAERKAFGETIERRVWGQDYTSQVWSDASTEGSMLRYMDKIQTSINYAGKVVSSINFLPKLTDMMLRGIRQDALLDTIKWANGGAVGGILRKPFSDKKLLAAGIDSKIAEQLKGDIQKYVAKDTEGNLKDLKMDDWIRESPDTFWRWKTLIDNQSMRAMTQHTIGNKGLVNNSSPFAKLFFQFKDFSLKTMNSQAARMFTHREIDDAMSLMYGIATNALVYSGLAYAKAWAYFGDNAGERKQYLDRALSPKMIALAGVLRGTVGTALSFGTDAYEAITGAQSFRTTVSREPKKANQRDQAPTVKDSIGNVIAQLPAVRAGTDLVGAGMSGARLAARKGSQEDIKQLFRVLPLQNSAPMIRLSEMLATRSGLPVKRRPERNSTNNN